MSSPIVISVFRRPEMLLALLSERRSPFDVRGEGEADPYVDRVVPLSQVHEALIPWRDEDLKAWKSLGRVPNMSGRASKAIVRSLLGTVTLPELEPPEPEPVSFGKSPVDLRPALCHPSGEQGILKLLGEALPSEGESELPGWHWTHRDELHALPESFRRYFLWSLSLSSWQLVELYLAVHDSFELEKKPSLRRGLARLARNSKREEALWWCDAIAELEGGEQVRAVELILELGWSEGRPGPELAESFKTGGWRERLLQGP